MLIHPTSSHFGIPEAQQPAQGTVRISYTNNLKRKPEYLHPDEYLSRHEKKARKPRTFAEDPWHPFKTRSDFDFAELVFNAHLSREQISSLLGVVQRCIEGADSLTFGNYSDVHASWSEARHLVEPVCCHYCYSYCRSSSVQR